MRRVGVDVGGTHTDLVLIDEERGEVSVHKVPTTVGWAATPLEIRVVRTI